MKHKARALFAYLLCLGVAIALFVLPFDRLAKPQPLPVSTEIRGVWITNVGSGVLFVPWGVNRAIHQLAEQHFNTIYPVVWNRGQTFYPSALARRFTGRIQDSMLDLMRFGGDVLAEMVKQGHRHGLRVIPWFEYGFMAPTSSTLVRLHPEWIAQQRQGIETVDEVTDEPVANKTPQSTLFSGWKKVRQFLAIDNVWLNPLYPDVQKFILDLIVEVVTEYDVDGIQLDDHFGMPVELGYDLFTVALYQQEHNGNRPPDNHLDSEWMRWRANKITDFMLQIYKAVKSVKPDCLVSLSPNSYGFAYRTYLQDWQTWVQQGLVDELIVQVYRDSLSSFEGELNQPAIAIAQGKIPVGIGILSGTWRNPVPIDRIEQQVQLVRDRGFDGVSFFYWETLWSYITPESPQERRNAFQTLFSPSAN